jgi:glutamyl-tRNA synthetase/nondiscriminating glutamyl-tRNA synthetase
MIESVMDSSKIRVRFAPSPTGLLHVGNARTALYNWLFARRMGGKFILRIEDTDLEHSDVRYEKKIMEDMIWLGLDWDEGPLEGEKGEKGAYGPYRQSQRLDVYAQHTQFLLKAGKAYRCFCTPEELEEERKIAIANHRPQIYSGKCRSLTDKKIAANLSSGMSYAVRLKIPNHPIRFHDIVRGDLTFAPETISDPILVRSAHGTAPGVPVYNYVVTVDDALMDITHVIRGDDLISNTPKQVAIYEAFGWPVPQFAHLFTILGADRDRLSKRHGATSLESFRGMGYLPESLFNYLALLGWSTEDGATETFTPPELVKAFSLEHVTPSPAVFDLEKLNWLNRHYMKLAPPSRLAAHCWDYFGGLLPEKHDASDPVIVWFFHLVGLFAPTVNHLDLLPAKALFLFRLDPALVRANEENAAILAVDSAQTVLTEVAHRARAHSGPVTAADFSGWMNEVKEAVGVNGNELYHPVRIALTGTHSGPDFDKLIPLIEQGATLNLGVLSVRDRLMQFVGV